MSNLRVHLLAVILTLGLPVPASAVTPWLPDAGVLQTSVSLVYETFDEYYAGEELGVFPFEQADQWNVDGHLDYGLLDYLTFDLTMGWVRTVSDAYELTTGNDLGDAAGLNDVHLGLTWRLFDEFDYDSAWVPSVAFRAGAIIAGTYDQTVFPLAAGDKASGLELDVVAAKVLPHGFGAAAAFGIRDRNKNVPFDLKARGELFYSLVDPVPGWLDAVNLSVAFDYVGAIDGADLGDPGFTGMEVMADPQKARELREVVGNIEAGIGVEDAGGRYYNFFYARTLTGRNTGKKHIFGGMVTIPWELPLVLPR